MDQTVDDDDCIQQKLQLKMDKENVIKGKSPLREKPFPIKNTYETKFVKPHRLEEILIDIREEMNSSRVDIFDIIMGDPFLKEFNHTLEKQAEELKKNKLYESFPLRYRNLVHTQSLYQALEDRYKESQRELKECKEMHEAERVKMMEEIQFYRNESKQYSSERETIKERLTDEIMTEKEVFQAQLNQKGEQLLRKIEEVNELERKIIKIKCEKDNMVEYIEEIREEADVLKKENERIVQALTQREVQISELIKTLSEKEKQIGDIKKKAMEELEKVELGFQEKLKFKERQCEQLMIANEVYENRAAKAEAEKASLTNQHLHQITRMNDQIEQTNAQLSSLTDENNGLKSQLAQIKQQAEVEIQSLSTNLSLLEQEVINKNIELSQLALNHELQLHKMKQVMQKLQNSKDETIEQIRQNVTLITQEKLLLHNRLLKSQSDKDTVLAHNEKLKGEIDALEKRILEASWQTRKSEVKGSQIEKLVVQFKDQLSKFQQIIDEKEEKIQEYRKDIFTLKTKLKLLIHKEYQANQELERTSSKVSQLTEENNSLKTQLQISISKQTKLQKQIVNYSSIVNKKKEQKHTQVQIIPGFNDSDLIEKQKITKQLEKTQQRNENILEELQQYKKLFKQEMHQKETTIKSLQAQNKQKKEMLAHKIDNNSEISQLFNTKIQELKSFYERKMEEQDKKYRRIIDVLKTEMTELYKEMDLKKSMEEEMFNEIMKINRDRKNPKEAI